MAVTPRTRRAAPRAKKSGDKTLSAADVLKAAETAIGEKPRSATPKAAAPTTAAAKPAAAKPAPSRKPVTRPATPASDAAPAVVAAAVMAVDAAPEPNSEGAETFGKLRDASSTAGVKKTPKLLPVTEGNATMNEIIENGKKFAEDAKAKIETAYADFNEKAKAGVEKSTKAMEEISDLAKGNVEALVESGKIAAKGVETLGQEAVDYSRKSFEKATASFKSFSTVKTPTEFFQLQSQLFATSFDDFAKEAAKGSETLLKLAGDVAQPLAARVSIVTDKVKTLAR